MYSYLTVLLFSIKRQGDAKSNKEQIKKEKMASNMSKMQKSNSQNNFNEERKFVSKSSKKSNAIASNLNNNKVEDDEINDEKMGNIVINKEDNLNLKSLNYQRNMSINNDVSNIYKKKTKNGGACRCIVF